jgi:hypothetical protein
MSLQNRASAHRSVSSLDRPGNLGNCLLEAARVFRLPTLRGRADVTAVAISCRPSGRFVPRGRDLDLPALAENRALPQRVIQILHLMGQSAVLNTGRAGLAEIDTPVPAAIWRLSLTALG